MSGKKISLRKLLTSENAILLLMVLLSSFFSFLLFDSKLFPGHDSPYYIHNSQLFLSKGFSAILDKDRLITFLIPGLISRFSNLPVFTSLKFFTLFIQGFFLVTCFLLGKKAFNSWVALLGVFLLLTSHGFFRLRWDFHANLLGLGVINIILLSVADYLSQRKIKFLLVAGFFMGTLFYIHNLAAISFSVIFISAFCLTLFLSSKEPLGKRLKALLPPVLILILTMGLISSYFFFNFFFPQKLTEDPYYRIGGTGNLERFFLVAEASEEGSYIEEVKSEIVSRYRLFVGGDLILANFLGIILLFISKNKIKKILLLLCFIDFAYFLMGFIYHFGFTFFPVNPDRFILFFLFFACLWSAFLIQKISFILSIKDEKLKQVIIVFLFLLFFSPRLIHVSRLYETADDSLKKELLLFMKDLPLVIESQNSRVIFIEEYKYWFQALAPDFKFVFGNNYYVCGNASYENSYEQIIANTSLLLSADEEEMKEVLEERRAKFNPDHFEEYVLVDTSPPSSSTFQNCINWQKFKNSPLFQEVFRENGFLLYKIKYEMLEV